MRSPDNLLDLYFQSVGKGASLLLNLPPDRRGRVHEADAASLVGFRERLQRILSANLAAGCTARGPARGGQGEFATQNLIDGEPDTYWATDDDVSQAEVVVEFPQARTFNIVGLREFLPLGQRVDRFALDIDRNGTWQEWGGATSIGNRRLLPGKAVNTSRLRLRILEASGLPGAFRAFAAL